MVLQIISPPQKEDTFWKVPMSMWGKLEVREICWCRTLYTSCALCNSVDICSKDLRQGFTDFFLYFHVCHPLSKRDTSQPSKSDKNPTDIWYNLQFGSYKGKGTGPLIMVVYNSLIQSLFPRALFITTFDNNVYLTYLDIKYITNIASINLSHNYGDSTSWDKKYIGKQQGSLVHKWHE